MIQDANVIMEGTGGPIIMVYYKYLSYPNTVHTYAFNLQYHFVVT
jgi:hypothetical protein